MSKFAVHLIRVKPGHKCHSLETISFFNAFTRFIAKRRLLRVIRTDNGTNLTSGEKELQEAIGGLQYLPLLQKHMKWSEFRRNVDAGSLILVVDDSTLRCSWPLRRVLEIYPNKDDGLVHIAQVKTKSGTFLRPTTKLCILECAQK